MSTTKDDSRTQTPSAAAPPAEDLSLWEKLGDALNSFTEGVVQFLTNIWGSSNERLIKDLGYVRLKNADPPYRIIPGSLLAQINDLEAPFKALSDDELRQTTPKLRERLNKGATLDELLPEAFAACREAARRFKNMRHYDVQLIGGIVLHQGKIAEMVTGEGKTLVATLPAFLNALEGKGVHIVTVNDYLARRDCEWMTPIYQGLGMTAGYIQADMDPAARRTAYDCDITYGTNSEFGFDYLRDNMKPARWGDLHYPVWMQQCQKALHYAIIDEVDNILIDEARTPLIISGQAHGDVNRYRVADRIARQLKPGIHFEIKEKEQTCHLTEEGIHEAERLAGVESFYTAGNMEWPHLIDQALKAHHLYKRDKRYMVMPHPETGEMSVIIVDEFTGRPMFGRQWSDGLHQAIEAKEGVPIKEETQTLATITLQNFFKLYKKLAGMTGTAMTEANEFWKIYKLEVVAIPTNRPLQRINFPDVVYRTEREKWNAIVDEIAQVHASGRPILVGTVDVARSEKLGEMLKRRGIKFELLNAKPEHVAREAEIIAQAGRLGAVTISTNMAGRGTDIILGGNPEYLAWARLKHQYPSRLDVPPDVWKRTVDEVEAREQTREEGRKVAALGGLHVIGTERHESRRIDNQLRGRAGRQGDPGSSRFYLSLQDDLLRIFGGETMAAWMQTLGMEEGQAIESKLLTRRIEGCQKKVEEKNFDIRKNLLDYDEVMDVQRKRVYGFRQSILNGENTKLIILDMLRRQVERCVKDCLNEEYGPASFARFASQRLGCEFEASDFRRCDFEEACRVAREQAVKQALTSLEDAVEENLSAEDPRDWNWEALSHFLQRQFNIKCPVKELKQIGREHIVSEMHPRAEKYLEQVDLSDGAPALEPDFGLKSIADWCLLKFRVKVDPAGLANKSAKEIVDLLMADVQTLYRQKELEFPVQVGLANFMAEHDGGGQRYNRQGLLEWARVRFNGKADHLNETTFLVESRSRLRDMLLEISRAYFPVPILEKMEELLGRCFRSPTARLSSEQAGELAAWAAATLQAPFTAAELQGKDERTARSLLQNAFDDRYRPEMRSMERSLLLHVIDSKWMAHLYTMDHLRAGVGLVSYAQIDPKIEYKRQGMKAFDEMWESVDTEVTDLIFRMEEEAGTVHVTQSAARHEAAQSALQAPSQDATDLRGNSSEAPKKVDPIRNKGPKVGRNDPCPCGSGKKHKNCCMKK